MARPPSVAREARTCEACQRAIVKPPYVSNLAFSKRRYCDMACQRVAERNPKNPVCRVCKAPLTSENWPIEAAARRWQGRICRACNNQRGYDWAKGNPDAHRSILRRRRQRIRVEVLEAYGNKCVCCGEATPEFLTMDHIHGGGVRHRKELANHGGVEFYYWLKKKGFPRGDYRILCYNCNCARGHHGRCPHEM